MTMVDESSADMSPCSQPAAGAAKGAPHQHRNRLREFLQGICRGRRIRRGDAQRSRLASARRLTHTLMDAKARTPSGRRNGRYNREDHAPSSDLELVVALQLEASNGIDDGEAWQAIRNDILGYAIPVLTAFIREGKVWGLYHRLGGPPAADLRTPARGVGHDDAHDLASDTVLGSLAVLRRQLIAGRWEHTGGASIRTWAVGLAIHRLPGSWRSWQKTRPLRLPRRTEHLPDADRPEAIVYTVDYERQVDLLDDDLLEAVIRLDCAGLSDREIGEAIGRTVKSVEYQLAKARRQLRRRAARQTRLNQLHGGAA